MTDQRLQVAKQVILDVLQGKITEKNCPAVFQDDLLYLNVAIVERADSRWLYSEIAKPAYERQNRMAVATSLSPQGQREVSASLKTE